MYKITHRFVKSNVFEMLKGNDNGLMSSSQIYAEPPVLNEWEKDCSSKDSSECIFLNDNVGGKNSNTYSRKVSNLSEISPFSCDYLTSLNTASSSCLTYIASQLPDLHLRSDCGRQKKNLVKQKTHRKHTYCKGKENLSTRVCVIIIIIININLVSAIVGSFA
jgi:hypothetical protein